MTALLRFRVLIVTSALASVCADAAFSGEAIVSNQLGDSVSIVDLDTMTSVAEIKIGGKPAGVAVSADKKLAYLTSPDSKEVVEIDLTNRLIARRHTFGQGPLGIASNPKRQELYVADWYAHKILVVSTAWLEPSATDAVMAANLTQIAEIPVGHSPSGLAVTPDGTLLLSADRDSDQVSFIDIATRKVVATAPTGKRPFGVTIDAAGKTAYTANVAGDDISVIDIASRKVTATIKSGHRPYAVALAAGKGFVSGQYSGTIDVFDATTLQPVTAINACDHPEGIEADASGKAVYAACWGDNILLKIDAATLKITGKAAVGDGPRAFGKFLR
jgi:YVTN family beta-propeller protein